MARLKWARVSPSQLTYKIGSALDIPAGTVPGDWDIDRRIRMEDTDKYRSIFQRYVEGREWEDTDVFRNIYERRFGLGGNVRGCANVAKLAEFYRKQYDPMFAHMKANGFVITTDDGCAVSIPHVFVCRDGELAIGNNGNHRIPMAKVLGLDSVVVELRTRHPDAPEPVVQQILNESDLGMIELPDLHIGATDIPAMTTIEERMAYYHLARGAAPRGEVVELGTWLGASTVFIAAGIRDSGVKRTLHTYDKFKWNPTMHSLKAGFQLGVPMVDQVKKYLGPFVDSVKIHEGEITETKWKGGKIALICADAPKHVKQLSSVLQIFGPSFVPRAVMSIQDFAYFPAFDLVVVMDTLERERLVSFKEIIYPGTTAVFMFHKSLEPRLVTPDHFDIKKSADEIENIWSRWYARVPKDGRPRFMIGAAMLMCDNGDVDRARNWALKYSFQAPDVRAKFDYLKKYRDTMVERYKPLFDLHAQIAR